MGQKIILGSLHYMKFSTVVSFGATLIFFLIIMVMIFGYLGCNLKFSWIFIILSIFVWLIICYYVWSLDSDSRVIKLLQSCLFFTLFFLNRFRYCQKCFNFHNIFHFRSLFNNNLPVRLYKLIKKYETIKNISHWKHFNFIRIWIFDRHNNYKNYIFGL